MIKYSFVTSFLIILQDFENVKSFFEIFLFFLRFSHFIFFLSNTGAFFVQFNNFTAIGKPAGDFIIIYNIKVENFSLL